MAQAKVEWLSLLVQMDAAAGIQAVQGGLSREANTSDGSFPEGSLAFQKLFEPGWGITSTPGVKDRAATTVDVSDPSPSEVVPPASFEVAS